MIFDVKKHKKCISDNILPYLCAKKIIYIELKLGVNPIYLQQ
jgi:hypothetical protein